MTTVIPTAPVDQLNTAFQEVRDATADLEKKKQAERDAQTEASDTSGLVAAARRDFKNAEARCRVLSATDAEAKKFEVAKRQHDAAAAELERAETTRDAARLTGTLLGEMITAVQRAIAAMEAAKGTTEGAQSTAQSASDVATSAGRRNSLRSATVKLGTHRDELEGHRSRLNDYLTELDAKRTAVNEAATQAAGQVSPLKAEVKRLETELAKSGIKWKDRPSAEDVREAETARDAAKRALEDAPGIERQAREAIRSAREAREDAEKRLREALDRRDKVERLFITGIDVTGPNANGTFTAKADVRESVPADYRLHWSSNAGSVVPETGGPDQAVSFHTKDLPPGSYDITVRLEQI